MLPVAATTAAAGVIVGVVTAHRAGAEGARGSSSTWRAATSWCSTTVVAALAVLVLGLAVPVTASFIIAAVIIGPALQTLGVPPEATYMFIFYYAVLSEVTPPTALAAVAAAAITGGDAIKTMMVAWKYTLPAFLVPFAFVLAAGGARLLGQAPLPQVLLALAVSAVAVAALAAATGGWMIRRRRRARAGAVRGRRARPPLPRTRHRRDRPGPARGRARRPPGAAALAPTAGPGPKGAA